MNSNTSSQNTKSRIVRHLFGQAIAAVFIFAAALIVLYFGAAIFLGNFFWLASDPLYQVFALIRDTTIVWAPLLVLLGIGAILYYSLSRPLAYLDAVVQAAKQLALDIETPISLPPDLHDTEHEMNSVRLQAIANLNAAKEAEQRKNDLIVCLAHDLKTPLTSVIGYLNLLQDEPQISPELRARYTGIALDKAQRLEDLLNEFFDITRFQLSSLTLQTETLDLSRMLEQLTFEFQPVLAEKQLQWALCIAPEVQIQCDGDKLQRVFDNLFRNAVNYSYRDGEISLSLAVEGTNAVVRIENSGKTLPPEMLERIFDQFYRADFSRASATGGAGLGLAIARQIVEQHGGSITAESQNERIAFRLVLPLVAG